MRHIKCVANNTTTMRQSEWDQRKKSLKSTQNEINEKLLGEWESKSDSKRKKGRMNESCSLIGVYTKNPCKFIPDRHRLAIVHKPLLCSMSNEFAVAFPFFFVHLSSRTTNLSSYILAYVRLFPFRVHLCILMLLSFYILACVFFFLFWIVQRFGWFFCLQRKIRVWIF